MTESDIVSFAGISGDWNPLHTDREFAAKSRFGQRIAHGALTLAVMTGFLDQLGFIRETVIAFYGADGLRFVSPVFIGDTLHVEMEVVEKRDRGKDGLITVANTVFNQKMQKAMVCRTSFLMKKRP